MWTFSFGVMPFPSKDIRHWSKHTTTLFHVKILSWQTLLPFQILKYSIHLIQKGVTMSCDNVLPHIVVQTFESLRQPHFRQWSIFTRRPKLVSSDYGPLQSLKCGLRGHYFASNYEEKEVMHVWQVAQSKEQFSEDIQKLVDRCTKCVE
jgi:hypothetical protein